MIFLRKNNLNLKQRLIISMVLIIVLSISFTSYIILNFSKNIIHNKSIIGLNNSIEQISNGIDNSIQRQVYNISNMLMCDRDVCSILAKNYNKFTEQEARRQKLIDQVLLSNTILTKYFTVYKDIKIAALYGSNDNLYNISYGSVSDDKVKNLLENLNSIRKNKNYAIQWYPLQENFFNDRLSNNTREKDVVIATRGIYHYETQEYLGTCIFTIEEKNIYEKYKNIELGSTGEIFIINENGNLISHSNTEELNKNNVYKELTKKILGSSKNVFTMNKNGTKLLCIFKKSDVNDWYTVGLVPNDEIYNEINMIKKTVILIIIITILIAISIMIFISDRVVKPIRKIIETMEIVEKGNLDVRVDVKGEYEVSNLAKYFNNMISKIKILIYEEYELKKKQKEAELDVLMAQINPHFIYNTLESVVWMAESIEASEISKMVSSLGTMLRIGMRDTSSKITIKEELDHIKSYAEIQKIRYENRFDLFVDVKDEDLLKCQTLKFILQPLVENSLAHGYKELKHKLEITINVFEHNGKIIYGIKDNGSGISEQKLLEIYKRIYFNQYEKNNSNSKLNKRTGIGLRNVSQRLRVYFGDGYGLQISSNTRNGTIIYVLIPKKYKNTQ